MKITRDEFHLITIALEQLTHSDTEIIEDLERHELEAFSTAYKKELENATKLLDKIYEELYKLDEH